MRKFIVKGKEITSVSISSGNSPAERKAAEYLGSYLDKLAGVKNGGTYPITLNIDASIGRDGYRVSVCDCCGITISGGNGRGVIYGVFGFLEKYAGYYMFTPTIEAADDGDIEVDEGFEFVPVFEYRQSDWPCTHNNEWAVRNGINCYAELGEDMGGSILYNGFVHTMGDLTGTPRDSQPCLSDPEMLKRAIASVRKRLKENPGATIVSVSQNDCGDKPNCCTCEKCAAVDAEEGSHMGTLLRFVNAVADDIREDYPNVVIDTLSYRYTRTPPKITKPRDNVCIRLCSIECCFCHPLDDATCEKNAAFHNDIVEWSKICDRIYIWDYVTNFRYYVPTFPNFDVLRQNMRFFAEHGVRGMYPEGNYSSAGSGEFAELRGFLLARLMLDPNMSTKKYYDLMDKFLAAYYGDGWRYIRSFIDFSCMEAKGAHAGIYAKPFAYIPREKYEAMEDTIDHWWDMAEKMAGSRLENVKKSRCQWTFIKLMLHPDAQTGMEYLAYLKEKNIQWSEGRSEPKEADLSKSPETW